MKTLIQVLVLLSAAAPTITATADERPAQRPLPDSFLELFRPGQSVTLTSAEYAPPLPGYRVKIYCKDLYTRAEKAGP